MLPEPPAGCQAHQGILMRCSRGREPLPLLLLLRLLQPPWTVAHQAPLSMGFPRQEYWNGLPFPSPGDLSNPGIEPTSLVSPALAGGFFTTASPGRPFSTEKYLLSLPVKESDILLIKIHTEPNILLWLIVLPSFPRRIK